MKPLLKWTVITLVALLILVGGATLALRVLVDEDQLRTTLLDLVNARIDGELRIDGPLQVSVWPALSVAAKDIHLSTPSGATQEFASARELRLGVALLPLLSQELQVHELRIAGLRLAAECDRSGKCNWAALGGAGTGGTPTDTDAAQAGGPAAAAPLALGIERIRIDDAALSYSDARDATHIEVSGLTLAGDGINSNGKPFDLRIDARISTGTPAQEFGLKLQTTARVDGASQSVELSKAALRLAPAGGPAFELKLPQAQIDLGADTLQAAQLELSGTGLDATASLDAGWADPKGARAHGKLELKSLDLPKLLGAFGSSLPPTVKPEPLSRLSLSADYSYDPGAITLSKLQLTAGKFQTNGRVRLGLGENQRIDATLDSPELDLDDFLAPSQAASEKDGKETSRGDGTSTALGGLLTMSGDIEANIGHLKHGKLELDQLKMQLALAPHKAQLKRLEANMYGGTLAANGVLAARSPGDATANLDARLARVDLERLLALGSDTQRLSGRVDASLKLAAKGAADTKALLASLSGPVELTIADPVIKDLSIEETICKAAAAINRESLSATFEPATHLQSIHTSLDFHDGVGQFRELGLVLPNMRMSGKGNIDLPRERLDVHLGVRVTNDLVERDPACRMSGKMLAIDWPLRCKGSFDEEPKKWCGIDKDGLEKIAVQLATEKVKEKVEDKLRDKLKGRLGDLLNRG